MKPEELVIDAALSQRIQDAEALVDKILVVLYSKRNKQVTDVKTLKPPRHGAEVLKGCLLEGMAGELFDVDGDLVLSEDNVDAGKYYIEILEQSRNGGGQDDGGGQLDIVTVLQKKGAGAVRSACQRWHSVRSFGRSEQVLPSECRYSVLEKGPD